LIVQAAYKKALTISECSGSALVGRDVKNGVANKYSLYIN